tara:strand:- start:5347 stop:6045 length:699 start_codon:yes stop_codon:yes gene_type:complete
MKAFAIVVPDNKTSMAGFQELNDSYDKYGHNDGLEMHEAISVDKVEMIAAGNGLNWNYPWEGKVSDLKSGLIKSAYTTADPRKRISCFVSHWYLWQKCVKLDEMILILEHDSRFIKKLPADSTFARADFDIIGINDPSMATRKSKLYHDMILERVDFFQPVPRIDEFNIPQGLAGNSAYVIKPAGAKLMLELSQEYGMWPNDALMCYQLVPKLGVTRNFYTRIQGLRSTTTL